MIEDSLSFFMFVYDEPEDMIIRSLKSIESVDPLVIINNVTRPHVEWKWVHHNLLNQSQARNWNQITRLTLLNKHEWCGIIAPDTIAMPGWLEAANEDAEKGLHLIGHLNFSIFKADTIRKLKWFDERIVSGGCEDLDMYLRFEEASIPFSRETFAEKGLERRGGSNQYRDTNEHVTQFRQDCNYWIRKWRKDKTRMPSSDEIYFHPENRHRNWEEINWYPQVLDRDAY